MPEALKKRVSHSIGNSKKPLLASSLSDVTGIKGATYSARKEDETIERLQWRYHLQELNAARVGRPQIVFAEYNHEH
jgi:hypothetical protein